MKKIILCVVFLLSFTTVFYAQAVVPDDMYRQVDAALASSPATTLSELLATSAKASWYPRLESYVLKKARQMVIRNELEQAKAVALAVVDNNLDNNEAVNLYQSIQSAITRTETENKKKTDQQMLDAYKQKAAEEKIKQDAAKTYKTVTNTVTGKKVYLDQDFNSHYRTYNWDIRLGLINVDFVSAPVGKSVKYGLSGGASLFYHGEDFSVGTDIEGDLMLLTLSGEQAVDWSGAAIISASSNAIGKFIVLRAGFATFGYTYGSQTLESSLFRTPVIGLGLHDVRMGESGLFQIAADYYPGSLYYDGMKAALGGNMKLSFILAHMQDFDIHFQTGMRDTVLVYSSSLKNDVKLVLGIGVGDYE